MTRWKIAFAAIVALFAGPAFTQDIDLRELQRQLAEQQRQIAEQNARLNDLQAKLSTASGNGGTAENILSTQKNASITVGGSISTPVIFNKGQVDSAWRNDDQGRPELTQYRQVTKIADYRATDLFVDDAKIDVSAKIGDWFEAYIKVDLHSSYNPASANAEQAYLHWKNICNSGFGVLLGRADLVFTGGDEGLLYYYGYYGGSDQGSACVFPNTFGAADGMLVNGAGIVPPQIGFYHSRTTQLTPYWESQDGRIKAEVSYIQAIQSRYQGGLHRNTTPDGVVKYRSINDGLGSGSARVTWKPLEGLKLSASVLNLHNNIAGNYGDGWQIPGLSSPFYNEGESEFVKLGGISRRASKNNTATNLHIAWEPNFLSGLKVWAAWNHEWNAGFVQDLSMDLFHGGVSYALNERLRIVGVYEYMAHKNKLAADDAGRFYKSNLWSTYVGVTYNFGSGVWGDIGWRHEDLKFKDRQGWAHTKAKIDTIYAVIGFTF